MIEHPGGRYWHQILRSMVSLQCEDGAPPSRASGREKASIIFPGSKGYTVNAFSIMAIVFGACCYLQTKTLREAGLTGTATLYSLACAFCLASAAFQLPAVVRVISATCVVAMMITSGMKLHSKGRGDASRA